MTHICVSNLNIVGSDNGLSPDRRQAITWTKDDFLTIGALGTNFSENWIEIRTFSLKNAFENVVCEMAAILSRRRCIYGVWKLLSKNYCYISQGPMSLSNPIRCHFVICDQYWTDVIPYKISCLVRLSDNMFSKHDTISLIFITLILQVWRVIEGFSVYSRNGGISDCLVLLWHF